MPASIEELRRKQAKVTAASLPRDLNEAVTTIEDVCGLIERGADCVGCDAVKPEPKPWVSTRTVAWAALLAALFLPPLIPLDEIIGTATAFRGPAVGFHEMSLLTPVVHRNDPLIIRVKSEYLRVCQWRWVLEWSKDGRPFARNEMVGAAHIMGSMTEHDVAIDLPKGISPGNYALDMSGTGVCGNNDVVQAIDPQLPFLVTD